MSPTCGLVLSVCVSASPGGYGELQAAGAGGADVSECAARARGGDAQPGHLPHGTASAAGGQPAAARGHTAVQHPAGTLPAASAATLFGCGFVYSSAFSFKPAILAVLQEEKKQLKLTRNKSLKNIEEHRYIWEVDL